MLFLRLFLANTWEKNRGSPYLFPHKLLWKVVWINNLLGGDWGEILNNAHRVPSCSCSSLLSVGFMYLISPTQKFKLEKSTLNAKEGGKSRFEEILELWILILGYSVALAVCLIPVSWGSIFFLLLHNNTWQRNLKKRLLIPILHMFACWFLYTAKVNSAANFGFTSKIGLPRVVLVI